MYFHHQNILICTLSIAFALGTSLPIAHASSPSSSLTLTLTIRCCSKLVPSVTHMSGSVTVVLMEQRKPVFFAGSEPQETINLRTHKVLVYFQSNLGIGRGF